MVVTGCCMFVCFMRPGRYGSAARAGFRLVARMTHEFVRTRTFYRRRGYSITSSARTSSDGGTSRPMALAVLRLIH